MPTTITLPDDLVERLRRFVPNPANTGMDLVADVVSLLPPLGPLDILAQQPGWARSGGDTVVRKLPGYEVSVFYDGLVGLSDNNGSTLCAVDFRFADVRSAIGFAKALVDAIIAHKPGDK